MAHAIPSHASAPSPFWVAYIRVCAMARLLQQPIVLQVSVHVRGASRQNARGGVGIAAVSRVSR